MARRGGQGVARAAGLGALAQTLAQVLRRTAQMLHAWAEPPANDETPEIPAALRARYPDAPEAWLQRMAAAAQQISHQAPLAPAHAVATPLSAHPVGIPPATAAPPARHVREATASPPAITPRWPASMPPASALPALPATPRPHLVAGPVFAPPVFAGPVFAGPVFAAPVFAAPVFAPPAPARSTDPPQPTALTRPRPAPHRQLHCAPPAPHHPPAGSAGATPPRATPPAPLPAPPPGTPYLRPDFVSPPTRRSEPPRFAPLHSAPTHSAMAEPARVLPPALDPPAAPDSTALMPPAPPATAPPAWPALPGPPIAALAAIFSPAPPAHWPHLPPPDPEPATATAPTRWAAPHPGQEARTWSASSS